MGGASATTAGLALAYQVQHTFTQAGRLRQPITEQNSRDVKQRPERQSQSDARAGGEEGGTDVSVSIAVNMSEQTESSPSPQASSRLRKEKSMAAAEAAVAAIATQRAS